jgi:TP901 family phage tail tape measure protein
MTDKEASVRLTVKDGGFRRAITGATQHVKRSAASMGAGLRSSLTTGAAGGIKAIQGIGGSIKSAMGPLTGIVGVAGFTALAKGAVDAEDKFRALAFTMSAGSDQVVEWDDLQRKAQASAKRWGEDSDALAGAMDTVFNTVGDGQFTVQVLDDIAKAARASGEDVSTIAPIVAEMNRQFGVTADEVPEALASVLSLGSRGGLSVKDLGNSLGMLGKVAGIAGLEGEKGMRTMLGLVNELSAASGNSGAAVGDLTMILRRLVSDKAVIDNMKKNFKIDVVGDQLDAVQALRRLLAATGGKKEQLGKIFTEKAGTIAEAFGERFGQIVDESAGTAKERTDAALDDFDKRIAQAAQSAISASDVQAEAEKKSKTASANMARAMEQLREAFTTPEMINALTSLAEQLPKLAGVVAKVIAFATESPVAAGSMAVGGMFAKGAIGAMLTSAITGGGGTAATTMGKSITTAGASAAGSMKGGIMAGGTAATAAIAAAGIGMSLAWEQARKWGKEERTHKQDLADERENIMKNAERQGDTVAARHRSTYERLTSGWGAPMEYLRRNKQGQIETSIKPFETPVAEQIGGRLTPSKRISQEEIMEAFYPTPAPSFGEQLTGRGGTSKTPEFVASIKASMDAQAKAASRTPQQTAKAIASIPELRVRITNPEDIATGPKKPVPGRVERD